MITTKTIIGNTVMFSHELLEELLEGCKNTYPNEFFALLSSKSGDVIDEYVVVPILYQAPNTVGYRTDLLPFDESIVGSFHSHPSGLPLPSRVDRDSFTRKGFVHIVAGSPFDFASVRAYDKNSKPLEIKLV